MLFQALPSKAVISGESANQRRFNAVGAINIKINSNDEVKTSCTATLISSKWIVTADHCFNEMTSSDEEGGGEPLPAKNYQFRLGKNIKEPMFKSSLKRLIRGVEISGEVIDVAFAELETPVPEAKLRRLNMISVRSQKWTPEDFKASYVHVGYGVSAAFSAEAISQRRLARFTVTAASGNALLNLFKTQEKLNNYIINFHPQALEAQDIESIVANNELLPGYYVHAWDQRGRTDLNNIQQPENGWQDTCFGDSGGPLLREINGKLAIVGVVSQGMDRICTPMGTRFTVFGEEVQKRMRSLGIDFPNQ